MGVTSKDGSDGSEGSEGKEGGSDRMAEIIIEHKPIVSLNVPDNSISRPYSVNPLNVFSL